MNGSDGKGSASSKLGKSGGKLYWRINHKMFKNNLDFRLKPSVFANFGLAPLLPSFELYVKETIQICSNY